MLVKYGKERIVNLEKVKVIDTFEFNSDEDEADKDPDTFSIVFVTDEEDSECGCDDTFWAFDSAEERDRIYTQLVEKCGIVELK
jgi:hypothetical protein